ncbi:MAG TPA: chemotaxis protein CheW [Gemmatimonadales bacterium]|nr:chemotaxis protein CheW [Gemmatimonadales bacterium]
MAATTTSGDELQFVVFRLGSQEFGLSIFQVERILRYEQPASLPNAPDFLEGVLPYGSGVVPLVDLRKRTGLAAEYKEETRVMVLSFEEHHVAVVVDQVVEVLRVDARTITQPPPMVRGLAAEYISGIISRPSRTIVVLNAARLLSSTERLALTEAMP